MGSRNSIAGLGRQLVVTLVLSTFPLSPLSLFPEDIVTKTVAMLGLAAASGVLALVVEPPDRPRTTQRV